MTENGIESYIGGYADYIAAKQEREAKAAPKSPRSVHRRAKITAPSANAKAP